MQGIVVPQQNSGAIFATDIGNGSLQLTITSLDSTLVGTYTCLATNSRGTHNKTVEVFGPPPPPTTNPRVEVVNGDVIVTWTQPTTDIIITEYGVTIYK